MLNHRSPASDPYWANVVALMHFDGANLGAPTQDATGRAWTANSNAFLSTASSRFGPSSCTFTSSIGQILTAASTDFGWGSGDWTFEAWVNPSGTTSATCLMDTRQYGQGIAFYVNANTSSGPGVANNSAIIAASSTRFLAGQWSFYAVARHSGVITGYMNGISAFSVTDSRTYGTSLGCTLGNNYPLSQPFYTYLDELRITKGIARYTANFAVPTAPFPNH
jgi:hypothetical protein